MRAVGIAIGLAMIWVLLWGSASPANVLGGLAIGTGLVLLVPGLRRRHRGQLFVIRPVAIARLVGHMLATTVTSNIVLTREVLSRSSSIRTAVVGVPLPGCSDELLTLITNLVANAVKFTDHGSVTVSVRAAAPEHDEVQLRVEVRDTGPGVDPDRGTETLAELVVEIDNGRWSGVPFRLRSGKALGVKRKEVLVTFKPAAHVPVGLTGDALPDRLRLVMGPDQITLGLNVNGPADPLELDHVEMDVELGAGRLPPYGEVLAGVLDGDPLLSVRGDTAEQCWRIVDPVLQAWRAGDVARLISRADAR